MFPNETEIVNLFHVSDNKTHLIQRKQQAK